MTFACFSCVQRGHLKNAPKRKNSSNHVADVWKITGGPNVFIIKGL